MRRLRDLFTLASRLRYLGWRAARSSREFRASLQTGERLVLRPAPAGDLGVAYEVFVSEAYRAPRPLRGEVRRIVDVGANVGYATVYLASRYPAARIIAFEPHPRHVGQLTKQLRANDLDRRVRIVEAAAGTADGRVYLTDEANQSAVVSEPASDTIEVPLVDFYGVVGDQPIDFLKIDCEGGEYALLADSRFEELEVGMLVVEWHADRVRPDGDRQVYDRLTEVGYRIERGLETEVPGLRFGLVWADGRGGR